MWLGDGSVGHGAGAARARGPLSRVPFGGQRALERHIGRRRRADVPGQGHVGRVEQVPPAARRVERVVGIGEGAVDEEGLRPLAACPLYTSDAADH